MNHNGYIVSTMSPAIRWSARTVIVLLVVSLTALGQLQDKHLLNATWIGQASPNEVQVLLHSGANLASRDSNGLTVIHHSITNPNPRVTEMLLEYGADPNVTDFAGRTALQLAIDRDSRQTHASKLIHFGANFDKLDPKLRDSIGATATAETLLEISPERLLQGDWSNHISPTELQSSPAFKANSDTNLKTPDLQALFRQILAHNRDPLVTLFLIECGAALQFTDGTHALHIASLNGNPSVLQELLDLIEPVSAIDIADKQQQTALHYSASNENLAVTELLLQSGLDVNARDEHGLRALHLAALNQNPAVTELLIASGADVNAQSEDGRTALHFAVANPNPSIVQVLINAGADARLLDDFGQTAANRAIDEGNSKIIKALSHGSDLSDAEVIIAIGEESRQAVEGILSDVPDKLLNLYLQISLLNSERGVAQLLLERGAKIESASLAGLNPNPDVMALLVEAGADVNATDESGLHLMHIAAQNRNPAIAGLLLEQGVKLNVLDRERRTPLHYAALNANPSVLRLLLEAGAEPNAEDRAGQRPLHMAALNTNPVVAEILIEEGGKLSAEDEDGRTALHIAAGWNPNPAVTDLFIARGANIEARDIGEATPLTLAWLNPRSAVPATLLRAGSDQTPLTNRLLDIEWLSTATAVELFAQIASALPSAFRQRDEECGRAPIHLIAHFAARNDLDPRLLDLDPQVTVDDLRMIDHQDEGFLAMLERDVSIQALDRAGNGILHYAVSGAAKVAPVVESQTFPSAGLGVLRDLGRMGLDGRIRGGGNLSPIHYSQQGRVFTTNRVEPLTKVMERWFGVVAMRDPASGLIGSEFTAKTDPCVVMGTRAEQIGPVDLVLFAKKGR